MKTLYLIGDGPREHRLLPALIRALLQHEFKADCNDWQRLGSSGTRSDRPRGYARKLQYAIRQARSRNAAGLVAVVDQDRAGRARLEELKDGRAMDRDVLPPFPTALGEAVPHVEAWLLDDPKAVRSALNMESSAAIPSVSSCAAPKQGLHDLWCASPRRAEQPEDVALAALVAIAEAIDLTRCNHRAETGMAKFADELNSELGPVLKSA